MKDPRVIRRRRRSRGHVDVATGAQVAAGKKAARMRGVVDANPKGEEPSSSEPADEVEAEAEATVAE